jgi:MoaA/NifB/PqqE/SkfB family radical SAM enzyme
MLTENEIVLQNNLKVKKPLVYEKMIQFDEKIANDKSITVIHIQYDTLCNMNCVHCCVPQDLFIKNTNRILTVEDIKNIFKQADELGLAKADLSGGEPTLFKELDKIIEAINPEKFWIQVETNGFLMTYQKAQHYKNIGIDKIQLSIDSLNETAHDQFRRKPGSWQKAIDSIHMIQSAGLSLAINSVVTHTRLHSDEFLMFLEYCKKLKVPVNLCLTKPVGRWVNFLDEIITPEDVQYIIELSKTQNISDYIHLPAYGRRPGCYPFRRLMTITKYGDVLPCLHLQFTVGNIFDTSLKDLIEKGMKYFNYEPDCLSTNLDFIKKYINTTTSQPIPIENILPLNWKNTLITEK